MADRWGALDHHQLYLADRETQPLGPTAALDGDPTWDWGDLLDLADRHDLDQLWVHPTIAVIAPSESPWIVGERDADGWWMTAYRPKGRTRSLVIPARNTGDGYWGDERGGEYWAAAADARQLAAALFAFRGALGILPWRGPATTGRRLLMHLHGWELPQLAGILGAPQPPEDAINCEPSLYWQRPLSRDERQRRYVHSYDKHGQFLAACSSLPLGQGRPEDTRRPTPEQLALPGYWRIQYPRFSGAEWPDPLPGATPGDTYWVTTPTLEFLRSLGPLAPSRGYFWSQHHRYLEPWYKRLRGARNFLSMPDAPPAMHPWLQPARQIARSGVKAIYTQTIGGLSSQQWDRAADPLYRPDWRDAIIGTARANLLRNVYSLRARGACPPFAVAADCLYFATDEPDAEQFGRAIGLHLGGGLGQYAVKDDSVPVAELRREYEDRSLGQLQAWLNRRREAVPA